MTMTINYQQDHWIQLQSDTAAMAADVDSYASTLQPNGPSADDLARIIETARTVPTAAEGSDLFLMVGEDGSWVVLEVNLLNDDPANPFDPIVDLEGLSPESITVGEGLAGFRVFSMQASGVVDTGSGAEEPLVVRVDYFLRHEGAPEAWVHAGANMPDPLYVVAMIPFIEQLLSGVEFG